MRNFWQRLILSLTPGVRLIVSAWTILFLAASLLRYFSIFIIPSSLALSSPAFFHGQVWRLASYALLPLCPWDWLFSSFMLICFGGMLERVWQRRDLLVYCLIAALAGGLAWIALRPESPVGLTGVGPVVFSVMLAAGRILTHEPMMLTPSLQVTTRQAVAVFAAITLILNLVLAGWLYVVILLASGGAGLLYLWLRSHVGQPCEARTSASRRISRLEL